MNHQFKSMNPKFKTHFKGFEIVKYHKFDHLYYIYHKNESNLECLHILMDTTEIEGISKEIVIRESCKTEIPEEVFAFIELISNLDIT